MAADLRALFDDLESPKAQSQERMAVSAVPIPDLPTHRIGKDVSGSPALLISTEETGSATYPVQLENLSVQHGVRCRIWRDGRMIEEGTFTVLLCPSPNPIVVDYFLQVIPPFLAVLGEHPTDAQVTELVKGLVDLFQALSEPPRKSVQGLWAELFLIAQAQDPREMIRAWHVNPTERYDFNSGTERIEVKSAAGRTRVHHFSIDQLSPPQTAVLVVASVLVEMSGGGTSIRDLAVEVKSRLNGAPDLLARLESVLGWTLGDGLLKARDQGFDVELAKQSLKYFQASNIPKPTGDIPEEVFDIRFRADLTNTESIDLQSLATTPGLFSAALRT
jgi:putative PD-(D/E)XK family protein DUF4420